MARAIKCNKLYITINHAMPTTLGAGNNRVHAFALTQITSGTVSPDMNRAFLKDFAAVAAAVSTDVKQKYEVGAWFQPGGVVTIGAAQVALDFIAATGVATTAASIDPKATRHFRLRAVINRLVTAAEFARTTANGRVYVQRQHSIEV